MAHITQFDFEVFDTNPASAGPCGWDVRYGEWGWPDPADYDDAEELLSDVLAHAVVEASDLPDYETGDRLWAQVTDVESDVIVAFGSEAVS